MAGVRCNPDLELALRGEGDKVTPGMGVDVFIAIGDEARAIRTAEHALGEEAAPGTATLPPDGEKRSSLGLLQGLEARQVEDRRADVDEADGLVDDVSGVAPVRETDEKGYAEDLIVETVAVLVLAVLAEFLTVIGGEDDEGVGPSLDRLQEGLEGHVGPANLAVVEGDDAL